MATKTISLQIEAYQKLKAVKKFPSESFSQVVMRATWPEETITGGDLLRRCREKGAIFSDTDLDQIESMKSSIAAPVDKWKKP